MKDRARRSEVCSCCKCRRHRCTRQWTAQAPGAGAAKLLGRAPAWRKAQRRALMDPPTAPVAAPANAGTPHAPCQGALCPIDQRRNPAIAGHPLEAAVWAPWLPLAEARARSPTARGARSRTHRQHTMQMTCDDGRKAHIVHGMSIIKIKNVSTACIDEQ